MRDHEVKCGMRVREEFSGKEYTVFCIERRERFADLVSIRDDEGNNPFPFGVTSDMLEPVNV